MPQHTVIGVDPGLSGVVTVLSGDGGKPEIKTFPNPFIFYKNQYARPVVDLDELKAIFAACPTPPEYVLVESSIIAVGSGGKMLSSKRSASGVWWYAGIVDTALRLGLHMNGVDPNLLEYTTPQYWQKLVLGAWATAQGWPYPKGREQWKEISIRYVREYYGEENLKFSRAKKYNDNISDSICIAELAYRVVCGEVPFRRTWTYDGPEAESKPGRRK